MTAATWVVQRTPNPAGGVCSELDGVSCVSLSSCTAVGFSTNRTGGEATLAERWNGSNWSIERTPTPAAATSSSLLGVSCASPRVCTAVGSFTNRAGGEATLAERWNGSSWAIQRTPNPAGATSSRLVGVSCPSPRSCTAVGFWYYISLPSSEVMLAAVREPRTGERGCPLAPELSARWLVGSGPFGRLAPLSTVARRGRLSC